MTISLSNDAFRWVESEADRTGLSLSDIIAKAVDQVRGWHIGEAKEMVE
jgi:hypothetical protein